jgi:hypothetical protein
MVWGLVLVLATLGQPDASAAGNDRIVGLVEIPKVFGTTDRNGPPGQKPPTLASSVPLHAKPGGRAANITIRDSKELLSREHGYEERSAVVFEEKGGWYLVEAKQGRGWLAPESAGPFRSVRQLILSARYLTGDWNRRIWTKPSGAAPGEAVPIPAQERGSYESWQVAVAGADVQEIKEVDGELWARVNVYHPDLRCESGDSSPKPFRTGWVPLYSSGGALNLWIFSRGC